MDANELRSIQAPIKERYRESPDEARVTLTATGRLGEGLACSLATAGALVEAGLHPKAGGDGSFACSGDMLLESLVACAGVTLQAVATALGIPLSKGAVTAEGDLDFRGTLGVEKGAPVGFSDIRLRFDLESDAEPEALDRLLKLTQRYCVVFQTLATPPRLSADLNVRPPER